MSSDSSTVEPAGVDERAVGDQLIARLDPDHVAGHHLVGGHLDHPPVADRLRARSDQQGQAVEGLLRPQLLADADRRVDDRDQPEERVGPQAERQDEDEEAADDRVEQGQDVGGDDARDRAAVGRLGLAQPGEPARRLGAREPVVQRCGFHRPIFAGALPFSRVERRPTASPVTISRTIRSAVSAVTSADATAVGITSTTSAPTIRSRRRDLAAGPEQVARRHSAGLRRPGAGREHRVEHVDVDREERGAVPGHGPARARRPRGCRGRARRA